MGSKTTQMCLKEACLLSSDVLCRILFLSCVHCSHACIGDMPPYWWLNAGTLLVTLENWMFYTINTDWTIYSEHITLQRLKVVQIHHCLKFYSSACLCNSQGPSAKFATSGLIETPTWECGETEGELSQNNLEFVCNSSVGLHMIIHPCFSHTHTYNHKPFIHK